MWKLRDLTKIITIYLGLVFISAAIFRIFNFGIAKQEMALLSMPEFLAVFVIIGEIFLGITFLMNKYIKIASISAIAFLVFALTLALVRNGAYLLFQAGKLFVFDLEITDFFLHLNYLVLLIFVYLNNKKSRSSN